MCNQETGLVIRCCSGDEPAWNELFDRYTGMIHAIGRDHRLRAEDREDVAQIVFTKLHTNLCGMRSPEALSKWIRVTTQRECWRVQRQSRGLVVVQGAAETAAHEHDDPVRRTELNEQFRLLHGALEKVSGRCRELLRALLAQGESPDYRRVSQQLHLPVGSIGPTRSRCFSKLAMLLGPAAAGLMLVSPAVAPVRAGAPMRTNTRINAPAHPAVHRCPCGH